MTETQSFAVRATERSRLPEVDFSNLKFGKVFADHMLVADFDHSDWTHVEIVPYGPIEIMPAMSALHYGQALFEGQKAYRGVDGKVRIFRPHKNWERFNLSAERMCMPAVPEDIFIQGLCQLISLDEAWVPNEAGASLYLRPFMFSTDSFVGIRPSDTYKFIIFSCPVSTYYSEPVRVKVEKHFTRAASGGTGFAKCAGNYGGALFPAKLAQEQGYHQLLWTDHKEHKYFEESGTMNLAFVINGTIVTPELSDTILNGVTRDSLLTLARHLGIPVEERKVSVDEVIEAIQLGKLEDAFGIGTAATIAPIAVIGHEGIDYTLPEVGKREVSPLLKQELDAIRYGHKEDVFGWMYPIS